LSITLSMPALAADATVDQIYEAARSGKLEEAQQMMDQVLRDHPASAKAHYVQAELYAREGNLSQARSELARAEQLKPGLPDENPRAVEQLKAELGLTRSDRPYAPAPVRAVGFPWLAVLILVLVVGLLWALFRRRTTYVQYPAPGAAPGAYGPGGYPGGVGPSGVAGGGIGSSIAGGLAGGLAAGAGIVAGEELAHHLLDGNRQGTAPPPAGEDASWNSNPPNEDMGGADFGVNDPGSWDDSSGGSDFGGGGGGGDDWT